MFLIISVLSSTEMNLSIGEKLLPFEKCPYSELCWSVFSHISTGYGDLLYKSPYSVQMSKKADQKISEDRHFFLAVEFSG